jgi:hypothetical protein
LLLVASKDRTKTKRINCPKTNNVVIPPEGVPGLPFLISTGLSQN